MAIRGRKPTATIVRLVNGNAGKRPIPAAEPLANGTIEKPPRLKGRAGSLWDKIIARAAWLSWPDGPKAVMWCHLQAEFERSPAKMVSARISQLRALGSELGLDPGSRQRIGGERPDGKKDPTDRFFVA